MPFPIIQFLMFSHQRMLRVGCLCDLSFSEILEATMIMKGKYAGKGPGWHRVA